MSEITTEMLDAAIDEALSWEVIAPLKRRNGQPKPEVRENLRAMLGASLKAAEAARTESKPIDVDPYAVQCPACAAQPQVSCERDPEGHGARWVAADRTSRAGAPSIDVRAIHAVRAVCENLDSIGTPRLYARRMKAAIATAAPEGEKSVVEAILLECAAWRDEGWAPNRYADLMFEAITAAGSGELVVLSRLLSTIDEKRRA